MLHFADVAQLAEQLICNQQVIGSSPIIGFMDGFPSGQRGQTVNLLQLASVVRIHLRPFLFLSRGRAVWELVGLITRRSLVQIRLPQPWFRGVVVITSACHAEDREFEPRRNRHFFWLHSSVGRAED